MFLLFFNICFVGLFVLFCFVLLVLGTFRIFQTMVTNKLTLDAFVIHIITTVRILIKMILVTNEGGEWY